MSRGLGTRQRLILQALAQLEAKDGQPGGKFYIWAVLKAAWDLGLKSEHDAQMQRYRESSDHWRAEMQARADAGDAEAARTLSLDKMLRLSIGGFHRRGYSKRAEFGAVEHFNPSRTLALLASRGLVERGNEHRWNSGGQGAWASLTDKGRAAV